MVAKGNIPKNNLGSFLTKIGLSSIKLHLETGVPTDELSKLRSSAIKSINAEKLYLFAKAGHFTIKEMLQGVYPDLKLKTIPAEKKKAEFKSMEDFFKHIDIDIIDIIAEKTDLTPYRIKRIKKNRVNPAAHELYSIELATKAEPGTLFNILYEDLQLNSPEEQERLRTLEKEKSKKSG